MVKMNEIREIKMTQQLQDYKIIASTVKNNNKN